MLFNSVEFVVFLVCVFALYWLVFSRDLWWRNLFLWAVSYLFYGWWDFRYLLLLAATSSVDFWVALELGRSDDPRRRRRILMLSLAGNLGVLATFKYFDFFVGSLEAALTGIGVDAKLLRLHLVLPVGLSFYTFQALSYTIDVYRRELEPSRDPVRFFAFVSFFPQLVAGPIERARNLLPQFASIAPFDPELARDGGRQMLWGFFKKMVVADNAARIADAIFNDSSTRSGAELVAGAVFFAFQIYGDFSGYTDIALGTAKLFGFRLSVNFRYPYFSRDIAEFWRRWHISLTTWFKDYVYVPLGGSRTGRVQSARNVLIVFLLSGLWHGANWTFVVWGGLNALFFMPLLLRGHNRRHLAPVAQGRLLPGAVELVSMLVTFLAVTLTWVFFRSVSVAAALEFLGGIVTPQAWSRWPEKAVINSWLLAGALVGVMLGVEWAHREREHGLDLARLPTLLRWSVYQALVVAFFLFAVFEGDGFIYFQF
jgi:D-alanyl-lipoteichoic acid acyltransferase DltB (MBOAT superfamily)